MREWGWKIIVDKAHMRVKVLQRWQKYKADGAQVKNQLQPSSLGCFFPKADVSLGPAASSRVSECCIYRNREFSIGAKHMAVMGPL